MLTVTVTVLTVTVPGNCHLTSIRPFCLCHISQALTAQDERTAERIVVTCHNIHIWEFFTLTFSILDVFPNYLCLENNYLNSVKTFAMLISALYSIVINYTVLHCSILYDTESNCIILNCSTQ